MPVRKDTLFEQFLAPLFGTFLIDQAAIRRFSQSIDWPTAVAALTNPTLRYPTYYQQNFHGVEGGYLTSSAAVTYDPITQYVLPPNETVVRQALLDAVRCQPRRIVDLGCGTGSMTLMLRQKFPTAEVIGVDLSPYMLVVAQHKATTGDRAPQTNTPQTNPVRWMHGNAEATALPDHSVDLVTAALLFHETPPTVSQAIVREAYRLLKPGGELVVLDGNQTTLRHSEWLTQIFEEPYIRDYAAGNLGQWLAAVGFGDVRSQDFWWVHQVTRGVKPLSASARTPYTHATTENFGSGWVPA